jgi:DeoR/GlpR family transcriptional regulator of sugar metabolism
MSSFERITAIDRALHEGGVTVAKIARRFEVNPRTVKRDIEYMRDRFRDSGPGGAFPPYSIGVYHDNRQHS